MAGLLQGLRIVEHGAFIAGPFSTMSLARFGAEVIRIDPLQGGIDHTRWPVTAQGRSLYWAGFNKGKKSIRLDLRSPEGQEVAQRIVTAPGPDAGLFVSNLPAKGWMAPDALRALRGDLIMISIVGSRDGSTAIDYTVNSAAGFPLATGPAGETGPINHVLPAWDLLCGMTASTALLAAERYRQRTGKGQLIRIALADIAFAAVGDLGLIGEVELNGHGRARYGNDVYGAFGRDFSTADGRYVMVAAVSQGQWVALRRATGIEAQVADYEAAHGVDLMSDTSRFEARDAIAAMMQPWFGGQTLETIRSLLDANKVCWGPYQTFEQMVTEDPRCSTKNPLFDAVDHPGIGTILTPASPVDFQEGGAVASCVAPLLGQHSDEILADLAGLSDGEIARLHDKGIVAGADPIG
ncbi:MAG: CoA transferase [Novosphingobium sp.]